MTPEERFQKIEELQLRSAQIAYDAFDRIAKLQEGNQRLLEKLLETSTQNENRMASILELIKAFYQRPPNGSK